MDCNTHDLNRFTAKSQCLNKDNVVKHGLSANSVQRAPPLALHILKPFQQCQTVSLPEDGRSEGDVHYPRGFATSWPKTEMQGINEYKTFTEMKRKEEAGELEQNFIDAAE